MLCCNVYGVQLWSFVVVNVGKKMQTFCTGLCMEGTIYIVYIQSLEIY